jgi:hypothetical protein
MNATQHACTPGIDSRKRLGVQAFRPSVPVRELVILLVILILADLCALFAHPEDFRGLCRFLVTRVKIEQN